MKISEIIQNPKTTWRRQQPASQEVILSLKAKLPNLPETYLSFLSASNGGEGELAAEPEWFSLWPAESLISNNMSYEITTSLPEYFGFGSNGGGELLAFGIGSEKMGKVFMIPFIPLDKTEAKLICDSFEQFLQLMK
jgi:hypothetical protein